jgi:hypothetical protein
MIMSRSRTTFDVPGWEAMQRRADRDNDFVRREWHGARYGIEDWTEGRHEGDPLQRRLALREPSPYQHPRWLGPVALDPGGPRILPVSQRIEHGEVRSRGGEFDEAAQAAFELGFLHAALGFRDRRFYGRRYRPTDNVDDLLGPQRPYDVKGWQADVPFEKFDWGW